MYVQGMERGGGAPMSELRGVSEGCLLGVALGVV